MKNQPNKLLTSFADHLTEQYGERGTPAREEFEKGFAAFKRAALQKKPQAKSSR